MALFGWQFLCVWGLLNKLFVMLMLSSILSSKIVRITSGMRIDMECHAIR